MKTKPIKLDRLRTCIEVSCVLKNPENMLVVFMADGSWIICRSDFSLINRPVKITYTFKELQEREWRDIRNEILAKYKEDNSNDKPVGVFK